jgi:putative intracellular protease/amidase
MRISFTFQIEDVLRRLSGRYTCVADWNRHVVVDGNLIKGQNPASSEGVAQILLEALR